MTRLSLRGRAADASFKAKLSKHTVSKNQNSRGNSQVFFLTGLEYTKRVQLFTGLALKFNSTSTLTSSY